MSLKIDVYSIMRNEIEIIPYFLRHYETFADRIFVWDDGSNDGTREILDAHPKVKVLPLSLGRCDDDYFISHLWPQYKGISRGNADWVMCVDADEFIYHSNIIAKIEELSSKGFKRVFCYGYTMYHPTFPTTDGQIYDEVKIGVPDRWSNKTVLFTPDLKMKWSRGRHRCNHLSENVTARENTGIHILHFRYLGWDYYRDRTKKNLSYEGIEFTGDQPCIMPDGSRRPPFKWFEDHKDNLIRLVE